MFLFKKPQKVDGYIKYHSLEDWWFSAFSEEEQKHMDEVFQPMGREQHALTQGTIRSSSQSKVDFLSVLYGWFDNKKDISIAQRIKKKMIEVAEKEPVEKPGYFKGRHYSSYVSDIVSLKREDKSNELETLLFHLVDATEDEAKFEGHGVAPFYYEELAILYRKQKEYAKEVAILERFAMQKHAPGVQPAKLETRLVKARELLAKGKQ